MKYWTEIVTREEEAERRKWRRRKWNRGEDGKWDRKRGRRGVEKRKEGMQRIWTKCDLLSHAFWAVTKRLTLDAMHLHVASPCINRLHLNSSRSVTQVRVSSRQVYHFSLFATQHRKYKPGPRLWGPGDRPLRARLQPISRFDNLQSSALNNSGISRSFTHCQHGI